MSDNARKVASYSFVPASPRKFKVYYEVSPIENGSGNTTKSFVEIQASSSLMAKIKAVFEFGISWSSILYCL